MKIGEYARTKTGIHKVFKINENATVWKYYCDKKPTGEWDSSYEYIKIKDDDIIKSSPNIIDLIEVGDYVNGREVRDVYDLGFGKCFCFKNEYGRHYDKTYKITSIVTKEQFESIEYKL